ncbi:MAG: hypothetical protein ACOYY2_09770 [Actinomycetota bacterium]
MAKALLGYVGGPDPRLLDEMRRLRQRVADLESEVGRLRQANGELTEPVRPEELIDLELPQREPALT